MSAVYERDLAHEADMEALRREQLDADCGGGDMADEPWGDDGPSDDDYNVWLANRKRAFQGR